MLTALLIAVAIIIQIALLALLIYCVRFCLKRFPTIFIVSVIAISLSLVLHFRNAAEKHWFSHLPIGLQADKILFLEEESWGIGLPGDNETGLVVYRIPDVIAEQIDSGGIAFLERMAQQAPDAKHSRGRFSEWQTTPITQWRGLDDHPATIERYLDRYGFGIPIDNAIKAEINRAIAHPGSYYAYGRIGVIIVIPKTRQVVFAYAG